MWLNSETKMSEDIKHENVSIIHNFSEKMLEICLLFFSLFITILLGLISSEKNLIFTILLFTGIILFLYFSWDKKDSNQKILNYLLLWYYWLIYGMGYFILFETKHTSGFIFHILVTIIINIFPVIILLKKPFRTPNSLICLAIIILILSSIPLLENNLFYSLWKTIVRIILSIIIYIGLVFLMNLHNEKENEGLIILIQIQYVFFGYFEIILPFAIIHIIAIIALWFRFYIDNVKKEKRSKADVVSVPMQQPRRDTPPPQRMPIVQRPTELPRLKVHKRPEEPQKKKIQKQPEVKREQPKREEYKPDRSYPQLNFEDDYI
jgi:hypothetical protein